MRAVAYLRVSTEEQADSRAGLNGQRDACEEKARREGWELAAVFADEGISGAKGLEHRPGLVEALASLRKGEVLLVAKRDRLARDVLMVALIEKEVSRKRCRIVSAAGEGTDGDDPHDPSNFMMRGILDVFNQYERLIIRVRTQTALRSMRARGLRTGAIPLGSELAGDRVSLIPNDAELSTIDYMNKLRDDGMSFRAIAARLSAEAVPTKAGGKWHPFTVSKILARAGSIRRAAIAARRGGDG